MPLPLILAVSCVVFALLFVAWRNIQRAYEGDGRDTFEDERLPPDTLKLAEHRLTNLNIAILRARANKKRWRHMLPAQAQALAEVKRLRGAA